VTGQVANLVTRTVDNHLQNAYAKLAAALDDGAGAGR